MDTNDQLRLLYLGILVTVIFGGVMIRSRHRLGKVAQQLGIWTLIFGGVILAVSSYQGAGFMPFRTQSTLSDGRIELAIQPDGHYYMTALVNGVPIEFVVDTGATHVVLNQADAKRIGIDLNDVTYIGSANTANGVVRTAPIRIETLTIGDITDRNIRAVVNGGPMEGSLLGMSYLNRFSKIEISRGRLILTR